MKSVCCLHYVFSSILKHNSNGIAQISSAQLSKKNRIYHRSLMQTEKSLLKGKRIMLETRFTEFQALSIDQKVGISRSASETND